MANTYLTRTQVAGNRQIFTQSIWFKLTNTADQVFISSYNDANNYNCFFLESGNQVLQVLWKKSGSNAALLNTTRKFRDTSAWYHVVLAVDTTQGTAANRIKLYVNGVQETSFSTATYPSQNRYTEINDNGTTQYIGSIDGSQQYFNGSMSYVAQIDGTAELPGIFGETDSTTGEWKIKTTITPSVALGNNGFLILKDGNTVTDSSTNSNNFTVAGGTLTKTEDNPSNVFCVINSADRFKGNNTNTPDNLRNGATKMVTSDASFLSTRGSIGVTSGKWYWEAKQGAGNGWAIGICNDAMVSQTSAQFWDNTTVTGVAINGSGGTAYVNGGNGDSWNQGTSVNSNTLYGFALDMDNRAFYISINGTYLTANGNVGDPTSGSSRTGSVLGELTTRGGTGGLNYIPQGELIYPFQADVSSGTYCEIEMNFGNGYFGTTAVSSAGTNASGIGIFEYDTPAGYTALSTKGLNL